MELPVNHREYDAHLLRAASSGPGLKLVELQLRERSRALKLFNPWLSPWHIRSQFDTTPFTIEDFSSAIRNAITDALREDGVREKDLSDARRLFLHVSHTVVHHAVSIHAHEAEREAVLTSLRQDLRSIQGSGGFVAATAAHPFWNEGREYQHSDGAIIRMGKNKPTVADRKIAHILAGPNVNIKGPDGRITEILAQKIPFLLTLEKSAVIRYAVDLREKLKRLLHEHPEFSPVDRQEAVGLIADEWVSWLTAEQKTYLEENISESQLPARTLLEKYFGTNVTEEEFRRRRLLLEQHTILVAHEGETKDGEELDALFGAWERIITGRKAILCDMPSTGLAFLAGNARYATAEEFAEHL